MCSELSSIPCRYSANTKQIIFSNLMVIIFHKKLKMDGVVVTGTNDYRPSYAESLKTSRLPGIRATENVDSSFPP
jgi:hypothetical protein